MNQKLKTHQWMLPQSTALKGQSVDNSRGGDETGLLDHIWPKAKGGTNRASNQTLACVPCNQKKGAKPLEKFLANRPEVLKRILAQAQKPLAAAAAVNTTRLALVRTLECTQLPMELASGGRTKWNRQRLGIPKEHCLDAACVGTTERLHNWNRPVLVAQSMGRGQYQRTNLTAYGFPRGYLPRQKSVLGFQTGDMVRALVPSGKKAGRHVGRIAVRSSGRFNVQTSTGVVQGINARYCALLAHTDGYKYNTQKRMRLLPTAEAGGFRRLEIR